MKLFSKKNILLSLLCISAVSLAFIFPYAKHEPLTFSNTQTWDEGYLKAADAHTIFDPSELSLLQLPPPPTYKDTQKELAQMHEYVKLRTPEKIEQIENEILIHNGLFGSSTLSELTDPMLRPATDRLIKFTLKETGSVIFNFKKRYDRVRPSFLDPTLSTALAVPLHPAYPSGHATQAHLTATILSLLDPLNKAAYKNAAQRIAHNREIAGLHYPSDSKTGEFLAQELFTLLNKEEEFKKLLKEAQNEW